jgi:hypothetical protein
MKFNGHDASLINVLSLQLVTSVDGAASKTPCKFFTSSRLVGNWRKFSDTALSSPSMVYQCSI